MSPPRSLNLYIDIWKTSSSQQPAVTNQEFCVICQEVTAAFFFEFKKGMTLERDDITC